MKSHLIIIVLLAAVGGIAAWLGRSGVSPERSQSISPQPQRSLLDARRTFQTHLLRRERENQPVENPPVGMFNVVRYPSKAGSLAAYLSPDPRDGKKHPAVIWVAGGLSNSIDSSAWEPASPDNDQSARAFREAGLLMMYPSFRGGNTNPGVKEAFLGEVDDLLAAADFLSRQTYIDQTRIYLGGHSTGGTTVLLAAESSSKFRATFAFGPVDSVAGYGPDALPFDLRRDEELVVRAPIVWLDSIKTPVFIFEGAQGGNVDCLEAMRQKSRNPKIDFHVVQGANHFSILAPITALVAQKIRQDTGASTNITFSDAELKAAIRP